MEKIEQDCIVIIGKMLYNIIGGKLVLLLTNRRNWRAENGQYSTTVSKRKNYFIA